MDSRDRSKILKVWGAENISFWRIPKLLNAPADDSPVERQWQPTASKAGGEKRRCPYSNGLRAAWTSLRESPPMEGNLRKDCMVINTNISAQSSARLLAE